MLSLTIDKDMGEIEIVTKSGERIVVQSIKRKQNSNKQITLAFKADREVKIDRIINKDEK